MQTLITGVPGSGKTLFAIEKLLLPVLGTSVKVEDADGVMQEHPRRIFTNIKGLQIEHELVEPGPVWVWDSKAGAWRQDEGNRMGWHNWHEWAPPGAILVPDEFQKIWPQRPNGAPVPPDISAMDTHRHMGVDFILITQAKNYDAHISGLVARHLHVRRMANMPLAIVYEWDHCSRSLLFSKALAKSPWRYDRKVYKLYRSADAHTVQPRRLPSLLWFLLAGIVAMGVLGPTFYGRMQERIGAPKKAPEATIVQRPAETPTKAASAPAAEAVASLVGPAQPGPTLVGCVASAARCVCFGSDGARIDKGPQFCSVHTQGAHDRPPADLAGLLLAEVPRQVDPSRDVDQDAHLRRWVAR